MRTFKSFKYAYRGLVTVWKEEVNFRFEVLLGLVVVFCLYYFGFSPIESALAVFAIALVLVGEVMNTVVEDICDKMEPNQDETIGKIKDLSASFVFLLSFFSIVIAVLVFYNHFYINV